MSTNIINLEALAEGLPTFLTVKAAAELLHVTPVTIYRKLGDRSWPSVKVGHRRLIPTKALLETLASTSALKGRGRRP